MAREESSRHVRARRWWLAGILALTLIGPAGAARAADEPAAALSESAPAGSAVAALSPAAAQVLELVNAERQRAGLSPLAVHPQLAQAAQAYSELMATTTCFSHNCPPEPDLLRRIELAGSASWAGVGENIAAGQRTAEEVMAGWMASPGHRANILEPRYAALGVGLAADGRGWLYWTQEFGIPRR